MFLHGVETITLISGTRAITGVKSGVIGIVGTAPTGPLNVLTQVVSETDGAQFGKPLPGFTIPKAIEARDAHGSGTMLIVNVYDPTLHNLTITGESLTITDGKAALAYAPMTTPVITNQASEVLAANTHYTIDEYGKVIFTAQALNGVTEVLAEGEFEVTGGSGSPAGSITSLPVNGVNILGATVAWTTSNANTAALIAAQCTLYTSSPEYTVTAVGAKVKVKALVGTGTGPNGFVIAPVVTGSMTVGNIVNMTGGVDAETATTGATADYERFDPSTVTAAEIIGAINPSTNARSGFKELMMGYNKFGYRAKLIICPGFSGLSSVSAEMATRALKLKAKYFIDAPYGAIPTTILTGRGAMGSFNFNTSDNRAILCYPFVKAFDKATNANEDRPFSQYLAALMAAKDFNDPASYAASPSNTEIKGIVGVERLIEFDPTDINCEANQLNNVGVTVIITGPNLGYRAWGNYTAAYPSDTSVLSFTCVGRTMDIINESIEIASVVFIDKPITPALIDSVLATVGGFLRTLEQLGRLVSGSKIEFLTANNPESELTAGHVTFDLTACPPTPAQTMTFKSTVDTNLLKAQFAQAA